MSLNEAPLVVAFVIVRADADGKLAYEDKDVDWGAIEHRPIYQPLLDCPGRVLTFESQRYRIVSVRDAGAIDVLADVPDFDYHRNPTFIMPTVIILDCAHVFASLSNKAAKGQLNAMMTALRDAVMR